MVKSSIIVPASQSESRKRTIDPEETATPHDAPQTSSTEPKKPRLELTDDGKKRGQRLFGVLLGTLNKFKDESNNTSEAEKKRREIDSKLHEKLAAEKKQLAEKIEQERAQREADRSAIKRREKRILEEKRDRVVIQQKERLALYLKTKAEPHLYYRPSKLTDNDQQQLETQKQQYAAELKAYEERREARMKEEEEDKDQPAAEDETTPSPEEEQDKSSQQADETENNNNANSNNDQNEEN